MKSVLVAGGAGFVGSHLVDRLLLPGWSCRIPYEQGVEMTIGWFAEQMRREQRASRMASA